MGLSDSPGTQTRNSHFLGDQGPESRKTPKPVCTAHGGANWTAPQRTS